ncbi:glycosylphosphatidylinositol transamidase [Paragonimus westermani]|uniref:Glycosylphosphatidylinositol transamidase n=1 Tax=Paragonimus westermani TaxID=34504 RepID=A0A5J4NZS8_9TREM|nr:glycosylphosphatidylinositol transamidase [Paragonimus westermani]
MGSKIGEKLHDLLTNFSTPIGLSLFYIGLVWFVLLSQDELNHGTYLSENALLVGQVVEKFDDSQSLARYGKDLSALFAVNDIVSVRRWLASELNTIGLEVYEQNFTFTHPLLHPLDQVAGTNLYTIMRSPSGGRTEALLLTVPLRTECSDTVSPCLNATVSLILSLLKSFRQQIYWAKDIIVVFPESDYIGLLAWLEAYHGSVIPEHLSWSEIEGRSGAIQAGLNMELSRLNIESLDISSEGINGLLANLDLVNTIVRLSHKHSIEPCVSGQYYDFARNAVQTRMQNVIGLLQAVWTQASGSPAGLHGLLINYQIPAVTLRGPSRSFKTNGDSRKSTNVGKLVEGVLRSLNNLQERLHQSFWYYLLPNPLRYISIGVYMPPVLLLIGSLLIKISFLTQFCADLFMLLQIIGFWWTADDALNADSMKKRTGKVQDKEDQPVESLNPSPTQLLPSDSDQTVRKRNRSHKVDKNEHTRNPLSLKKILQPVDDRFPSTLGRLTIWIIVSFLAGLSLHVSPSLILALYTHPASEVVQLALGVQPLISDFYAVGLSIWFGLLILLVPVSIRLLQWLLIAPVQTEQPWCATIILLGWTLFLACTSCLNVSASLLMSLFVVPVLLLLVHKSRQPRLHGINVVEHSEVDSNLGTEETVEKMGIGKPVTLDIDTIKNWDYE